MQVCNHSCICMYIILFDLFPIPLCKTFRDQKIPLPPFGHESKALLIRFYDEQTHNIHQLTENLDRVTMSSAFYSGVKLNMKK